MLPDEPLDDRKFERLRAHEIDDRPAPEDVLWYYTNWMRFGACLLILVGFGIAWLFERK